MLCARATSSATSVITVLGNIAIMYTPTRYGNGTIKKVTSTSTTRSTCATSFCVVMLLEALTVTEDGTSGQTDLPMEHFWIGGQICMMWEFQSMIFFNTTASGNLLSASPRCPNRKLCICFTCELKPMNKENYPVECPRCKGKLQ